MKTFALLASLLFPCAILHAEDPAPAPPKLVPRPIPGLAAVTPVVPTPAPATAAVRGWEVSDKPALPASSDQARILYIHRRATLPPALAAKVRPAPEAKVSAPQVQVRQNAVRIIPKSEAAKLVITKN
ncbi:hypothetical protein EI77_02007 [Prosthecobacter fusiformis]|uniref:Uncharacterized protein n=1 Tax=Prosthecobacter fusiformis TaxID=48464 RepID=A0A4R7RZP5_9BACT|nr:hypothetical protein [Prosthecobacter fusiformis]TDU70889.1 hypothetical protein EI77_02007 [Prosthecobacter fusiformis]